jgi:hypothetical protein
LAGVEGEQTERKILTFFIKKENKPSKVVYRRRIAYEKQQLDCVVKNVVMRFTFDFVVS